VRQVQGNLSVVRNAAFLFGNHALSVLVRGLYVVVVARALGPQAYGEFNYGLLVSGFHRLTYLGWIPTCQVSGATGRKPAMRSIRLS